MPTREIGEELDAAVQRFALAVRQLGADHDAALGKVPDCSTREMGGTDPTVWNTVPMKSTGRQAVSKRMVPRSLAIVGALTLSTSGCAWLARSSQPTSPHGEYLATDDATAPSISGSGRFTAFASGDAGLVPADRNAKSDVFVRDNLLGTTEAVSVAPAGIFANGASTSPSISDDGRYVAFASVANDLVGDDPETTSDIFVRDRQTGTTVLASLRDDETPIAGGLVAPDLSGDGQTVAFAALLILAGAPIQGATFVRHLDPGTTVALPRLGNGTIGVDRSLSFDGSRIAYSEVHLNPSPAWAASVSDAYSGVAIGVVGSGAINFSTGTIVRVTLSRDGRFFTLALSDNGQGSVYIASADGSEDGPGTVFIGGTTRYAAYENGIIVAITVIDGREVLIEKTEMPEFRIVSADAAGNHVAPVVGGVDLSADGGWVAFTSGDAQLRGGGNDFFADVYTRSVAQSPIAPS